MCNTLRVVYRDLVCLNVVGSMVGLEFTVHM